MTDLEKLIEATRITDEMFVERGYSNGLVNLPQYFFSEQKKSLYAFTSKKYNDKGQSAREIMTDVNRNNLLLEVQTKMIKNAANCAYSGVTKTDNSVINIIIKKAIQDIQENINSFEEMQYTINRIIQTCNNSEDIINAIKNNIKVLELSDNVNIYKSEALLLSSYAELIRPNVEQKVVFRPATNNGPKR